MFNGVQTIEEKQELQLECLDRIEGITLDGFRSIQEKQEFQLEYLDRIEGFTLDIHQNQEQTHSYLSTLLDTQQDISEYLAILRNDLSGDFEKVKIFFPFILIFL